MQDKPPANLLIAEVIDALAQGIAPGFGQKVASNALGIAQRENDLSPQSSRNEHDRLVELTGCEGDLSASNHRLAEHIRHGSGELSEQMIRHLIHTTLAKIEVDQPNYPPYLAWKDNR